ncbi:hypothetical protein AYI69_g3709 [Smittium culicis]|uniref:Uncharacterized protein n=1 Tax=Smittium culicis TaxID=133412 RepID=A0A1R1YIY6_9FUNG|nr:hypothetical protein AYI69_g3709 [Smittium culicis]
MDHFIKSDAPPTYLEALKHPKHFDKLDYHLGSDKDSLSEKSFPGYRRKKSLSSIKRKERLESIVKTRQDFLKINPDPASNSDLGLEIEVEKINGLLNDVKNTFDIHASSYKNVTSQIDELNKIISHFKCPDVRIDSAPEPKLTPKIPINFSTNLSSFSTRNSPNSSPKPSLRISSNDLKFKDSVKKNIDSDFSAFNIPQSDFAYSSDKASGLHSSQVINLEFADSSDSNIQNEVDNDEMFDRLSGMIDNLIITADNALKSVPEEVPETYNDTDRLYLTPQKYGSLNQVLSDSYCDPSTARRSLITSSNRRKTSDFGHIRDKFMLTSPNSSISEKRINRASKSLRLSNTFKPFDLNDGYDSDLEATFFRINTSSSRLKKRTGLGLTKKTNTCPSSLSIHPPRSNSIDIRNGLSITTRKVSNQSAFEIFSSPTRNCFSSTPSRSGFAPYKNISLISDNLHTKNPGPYEQIFPVMMSENSCNLTHQINHIPDLNDSDKDSSSIDSPSENKPWNPFHFVVMFYYGILFFLGIMFLNSVLCEYSSDKVKSKLVEKTRSQKDCPKNRSSSSSDSDLD